MERRAARPACADAIARIVRYPDNALNRPGGIRRILVNPINASVVYRLNKRTTVSAVANNLFNHIKMDATGGWPYYPVGSYSPAGRQVWLELNHHFGS